MSKSYQMDMCHGPLFRKIILFTLPLLATNILQLLFNAADMVVLGQFANHQAMAAVGATVSINSFFVSLFMGLGIGSNVLVARFFGSGDKVQLRKSVHTSMLASILCGLILMVVGLLAARPLLVLMKTPEDILEKACLYLYICFSAIPFMVIYNVGCGVLRALGDTMRPMYFLLIAGGINVTLNVILVVGFKMEMAGVAIATAVSHLLSAAMIFYVMFRSREDSQLRVKELKLDGPIFREMLALGIPASIQSCCFSLANMAIQSSINSFGSLAVAGCTAASGLEGFVWICSYSFHTTSLSFTAQNLGGKHFKRIIQSVFLCIACASTASLVMGMLFYVFARPLLAMYNPDPAVIQWGLVRVKIMFSCYFLCGIMDVISGLLRGLGHSLIATIGSLSGAFFFRIAWVYLVFPHFRTMQNLMISFPVSWVLVITFHSIFSYFLLRKLFRERTLKHGRLFESLQNSIYRSGPPIVRP